MKNIIILCTIFLVSICNAATYSGGTGIITSPYVIDSKADLLMLATNSGDFTKYFIMTSDIDLAGEIFTNAVIAASIMNTNDTSTGQTFSGNFNGNGHKIINLSINTLGSENDFLGLFGYIYAGGSSAETMIYNLEVQLVINTGQYSVRIGGICGYLGSGIISNCTTSVSMYLDEYNEDIGGICGHNYKGTIIDCSSSGEIDPDRFSEDIGGITGQSRVVGKVINCFSDTYIRCDDQVHRFGGIVGYNEPGCIISNCYTVGNVHSLGYSTFFGGLCGFNSGDIADSGAKCTVTASTNSVFYGGFIGRITAGIITNCYSASTIVNNGASVPGGGFSAGSIATNIVDCFWDIDIANFLLSDGGTATNTAAMKQETTFTSTGWDFTPNTGAWAMSHSLSDFEGYPVPQWLDIRLSSITITGPVSLLENSTAQYASTAYFSDGTSNDITTEASWSDSSFYATITNGLLQAKPITSEQAISITAEYSYLGDITNISKAVIILNTPYSGGEGTLGNPYVILDEPDLLLLSVTSADYDKHFKLDDDISMKDKSITTAVIAPDTDSGTVGFQGTPFTGSFDGNKHKISSFVFGSTSSDYVALFGQNSGTIHDLFLDDILVTGRELVAPLCAHNDGGHIYRCGATGQVDGHSGVAGFCAINDNKDVIEDCYSLVDVANSGISPTHIAGFCAENAATIRRCYSAGAITKEASTTDFGGFCGENLSGGAIENCFWDYSNAGVSTVSDGGTHRTTSQIKNLLNFTTAGWTTPIPWLKSDASSAFAGYMIFYWQSPLNVYPGYTDWISDNFPGGYLGDEVDSDDDNVVNGDEFISSTDPNDSNLYFCVSSIQSVSNGVQVSWTAATNRVYNVQKTTNLTDSFQSLTTINYPASSYTDTNSVDGESSFYSLKVSIE